MENLLKQELQKAKNFFETQGKSDSSFYKLYSIKYVDSTCGRDDLRCKNFNSSTLDESLESLERDIRAYGETSKEFFHLKHYNTPNDPQPIGITLKNPYFNPNNHKGSGSNNSNSINGLNSNNGYIEMMREHYTTINNLREKHMEFEHKIELREKEREIESLQDAKRGKLDAINDLIETPIGAQLAAMFMQYMQMQMMPSQNFQQMQAQQQVQQQIKKEPEPRPEQKNDNHNQEQEEKLIKIQNAIVRFEQTFGPDNGIDVLEDLSIFCKENPALAQKMSQKRKENAKN